jgi:SAM-dependent methyltransferase
MAAAGVARPLSAEEVFDDIGPAYEQAFAGLPTQAASIDWIIAQLDEAKPAKCLDIGCGTGRPVCSRLADAGHDVLGIDISGSMIEDAKTKVPNAAFKKMDVVEFSPGPATYDAVTVFFSMIASVTQEQIRQNIQNIHTWLKLGGIFVFATVPVAGNNLEIKWMGRPVTVSSLEADEAVNWIRQVGFEVVYYGVSTFTPHSVEAGICDADDVWEEPHLFVYAKKQ